MVRVAGLKGQQLQDVERRSADGRTPGQQLSEISDAAAALMADIQTVWHAIRRELAGEGIEMLDIERIPRSEEHTSELQSLMRISYAVFRLKKTKKKHSTSI